MGFPLMKRFQKQKNLRDQMPLIMSQRDNGLYDAINKGIRIASGDIIGILNADDFYPHNRIISIVHEVFRNSEIDACYGDLVYVDRKDTSRIVRYWRSSPYSNKLMNNGWMPPHPTFFVRAIGLRESWNVPTGYGNSSRL